MPSLSGKYNPAVGPLVNIGITEPGQIAPGQGEQQANMNMFPALIDTGASVTCISQAVIQQAGLQPSGKMQMKSATHSVPVNTYIVDLMLPFGNQGMMLFGHTVLEFNSADPKSPFQGLLGRDLLCRGTLAMSFDGHFTFSL